MRKVPAEKIPPVLRGFDVWICDALKENEAAICNVYYEGKPVIVTMANGSIEFSVIEPKDFWAV